MKQYIPRAHENEDGSLNQGLASYCNGCGHLMRGIPNACEACGIPFRAELPDGMTQEQAIRAHDQRRHERRRQGSAS